MAGRQVFAKVGDGRYLALDGASLSMTAGPLLEAMAAKRAFEVELRGVPLSKCAVLVRASAAKTAPPADVAACGLEDALTLGDVAAGLLGDLFIHVQLPASVAAGAGAGGDSMHRLDAAAVAS